MLMSSSCLGRGCEGGGGRGGMRGEDEKCEGEDVKREV